MNCPNCGFRVRGKEHENGDHHRRGGKGPQKQRKSWNVHEKGAGKRKS